MTLKHYISIYLSFQIDSKSKIIQFYSWIFSFARTSSQFLRKMTFFLIFFLEDRSEISEMRKNKQRFQAVKFQQEILKRQCHVIQNFLFLIFFCQTSLELKTFFFKNPSKSRFWLFDSSPYKIFLDFDFFKRTLTLNLYIQDIYLFLAFFSNF